MCRFDDRASVAELLKLKRQVEQWKEVAISFQEAARSVDRTESECYNVGAEARRDTEG